MKLIEDLGMKKIESKSGKVYRKRFGLYECPECSEEFEANTSNVHSGNTSRCLLCAAKTRNITHGESRDKLYSIWKDMKKRCNNPNIKQYADWGGRGIKVCTDWDKDYTVFKEYLLSLPNALLPGYSIDRINNSKNYEPGNMRWATKTEQAFNTRTFKSNTSGIRGVSWGKQNSKWIAYITVEGKRHHLGFYEHKKDAVRARELAEIKFKDKL